MLPLRTALTRASRSTTATSLSTTHLRRYSQQRQPSPTGAFYKTFTRPVAKCALLAVFVYQLAYFGWCKLEADEIQEERQAEITLLESQVRALQAAKVAEETAAAAAAAAATATGNGNERESGKDAGGKGGSWWPWS